MKEKATEAKHQPLTERELVDYLMYRYNLPSYADQVQEWRDTKTKPPPSKPRSADK